MADTQWSEEPGPNTTCAQKQSHFWGECARDTPRRYHPRRPLLPRLAAGFAKADERVLDADLETLVALPLAGLFGGGLSEFRQDSLGHLTQRFIRAVQCAGTGFL